jgi:hypothetical protein
VIVEMAEQFFEKLDGLIIKGLRRTWRQPRLES